MQIEKVCLVNASFGFRMTQNFAFRLSFTISGMVSQARLQIAAQCPFCPMQKSSSILVSAALPAYYFTDATLILYLVQDQFLLQTPASYFYLFAAYFWYTLNAFNLVYLDLRHPQYALEGPAAYFWYTLNALNLVYQVLWHSGMPWKALLLFWHGSCPGCTRRPHWQCSGPVARLAAACLLNH